MNRPKDEANEDEKKRESDGHERAHPVEERYRRIITLAHLTMITVILEMQTKAYSLFFFKLIVCVWFSMVLHTAKRSLALFSNVFSCSFLILGKRTEAGGQRMLPRLLCEEENNAKSPQIGHLTIHCRAQHGILVDRVLWQMMFRVFVSTIWSATTFSAFSFVSSQVSCFTGVS